MQNELIISGYRSPLRPLPHDVIPSDILLFDSTQRINYREDLDTNFGLELDGSHMEHYSCDGDELVTDSCNMESSWWQEAMTYADRIENMKNAPEFKISVSICYFRLLFYISAFPFIIYEHGILQLKSL